jgi:hypothetical protein
MNKEECFNKNLKTTNIFPFDLSKFEALSEE